MAASIKDKQIAATIVAGFLANPNINPRKFFWDNKGQLIPDEKEFRALWEKVLTIVASDK